MSEHKFPPMMSNLDIWAGPTATEAERIFAKGGFFGTPAARGNYSSRLDMEGRYPRWFEEDPYDYLSDWFNTGKVVDQVMGEGAAYACAGLILMAEEIVKNYGQGL